MKLTRSMVKKMCITFQYKDNFRSRVFITRVIKTKSKSTCYIIGSQQLVTVVLVFIIYLLKYIRCKMKRAFYYWLFLYQPSKISLKYLISSVYDIVCRNNISILFILFISLSLVFYFLWVLKFLMTYLFFSF